jgi:hypothetical protein
VVSAPRRTLKYLSPEHSQPHCRVPWLFCAGRGSLLHVLVRVGTIFPNVGPVAQVCNGEEEDVSCVLRNFSLAGLRYNLRSVTEEQASGNLRYDLGLQFKTARRTMPRSFLRQTIRSDGPDHRDACFDIMRAKYTLLLRFVENSRSFDWIWTSLRTNRGSNDRVMTTRLMVSRGYSRSRDSVQLAQSLKT